VTLWEMVAESAPDYDLITDEQYARLDRWSVARSASNAPALVWPFEPVGPFNAPMAAGHRMRHGHELTGYYVRQGGHGFAELKRTCCDA
jgi:hypothetical protein